ncbi:hypothetical protein CROQUDRAFT_667096 [Cronartium quercuum f. sp. fusiforme G11]|uniref:glutamate synthase (ferredoxin) n=1 Tax=Cronartium quercuum f. sp. fusiforme G11 TaxID=708437 RepID=A0A9P6N4Q8_9BASI|nr:hypothetical protein CROQUDRAFT_667096 [Cronartium quercuum f. sp. fusiforme G11]
MTKAVHFANPDPVACLADNEQTEDHHHTFTKDRVLLTNVEDEFRLDINPSVEIEAAEDVLRSNSHWAGALPAAQGLYDPNQEKDACGVGFVCQMQGEPSHRIVSDARGLLCNMTHRGATGADTRDGDGAGLMCSIPHEFFEHEANTLGFKLPSPGHYAVGNVFFKPDAPEALASEKKTFEGIADSLNLRVLGWREVPRDNSILGPAALSREPLVLQPFVVLNGHESSPDTITNGSSNFDNQYFERQLYVLRKHATHSIGLAKWFYICSLSNKVIVYKGQLSPRQVYDYFFDLNHVLFAAHFCMVHSRFSTNTFPSWDRAQPMRWAAHNGQAQFTLYIIS